MREKKEFYLTRFGKNYKVDENNPILKKWVSENRDHYDVLTTKAFPKDFHASDFVKRVSPFKNEKKKRKERGEIQRCTPQAMRRFKFLLRNTMHGMNFEIGLTYPNEYSQCVDGLVIKSHLHKIILRLNYRGYKHIWALEFQERGAPHFHMLLDKEISKKELAKMWFDVVGSGDLKHLRRGVHVAPIRSKDGMEKYFTNYLTKQDQKTVPEKYLNVGRFWGNSRNLLSCTIRKYYGNPEDIRLLKKELRNIRKWFESKKRLWSKKNALKGKFYKNPFVRKGSSFKIVYSNVFIEECRKRGLDTSLFDEEDASALSALKADYADAPLDSIVIFEEKKKKE
jgi:hypothetical protein